MAKRSAEMSSDPLWRELDSLAEQPEDFDQESEDTPTSGDPNHKGKTDPQIAALIEQNKNLQEHMRQQSEELKDLRNRTKVTDKLEQVFTGNQEEVVARDQEFQEREEFDKDPYSWTQRQLTEREKALSEKYKADVDQLRGQVEADSVLNRVKTSISKKYVIDWNDPKVEAGIARGLKMVNTDMLSSDPERAMIAAAYFGKVLSNKDRRLKGTLPFIEGGGMTAAQQKKAADDEKSRIKKAFLGKPRKKILNI